MKVLRPPRWMGPALLLTLGGTLLLFAAITYTVLTGIGVWGNNIPVGWAFGITNFVWWIGIGHAGTFISAFLLLLEQKWRTSINRFAEAMTLFAVMQAGLFPLLHLGRPWFFYWLAPYPNTMAVWPQFRSALTWDVVAVSTYFTISLLFWYLGLVPDLAAMRDRAPSRARRRIYGIFALGWYGSAHNWNRWRIAYGLLGGLAAPLVISVHSIVSSDFAIGVPPRLALHGLPAVLRGWRDLLGLRDGADADAAGAPALSARALRHHQASRQHGEDAARDGLIVTYSYAIELWSAWYSGDRFEMYTFLVMRPFGPYALCYWTLIAGNCVAPQLLWFRRMRTSPLALWFVALAIQVGCGWSVSSSS